MSVFPFRLPTTLGGESDKEVEIRNLEHAEHYAKLFDENANSCREAVREFYVENAPGFVKSLNLSVNNKDLAKQRCDIAYKLPDCSIPMFAWPNDDDRKFTHDDKGQIYYGEPVWHNKVEWIWEVAYGHQPTEVYKMPPTIG